MANQQSNNQRNDNRQAPAVVNQLAPSRLPITAEVAKTLGVTPAEWRVLVEQLYPAAKSVESVHLVLTYCRHRNLDPFKKPVHIVPVYSSALRKMVETVWPGIAELRTTASRTGSYSGLTEAEYGPTITREFVQTISDDDPRNAAREIKHTVSYPEWCRMTAWRIVQGARVAFTAKIYWLETYATAGRNTDMPNEMWRKRPFGQADKCAEAAVLRKAFPEELGGEYAAEEMQGRILDDDAAATFTQAAPENKAAAPRAPARTDKQEPPKQETKPANKKPAEDKPEGKIIEGEVLPPDDDGGDDFPGDRPDFFGRLEKALNAASDEESFSDTWDSFDALAVLDGNDAAQTRALDIKRRAYARLVSSGGR